MSCLLLFSACSREETESPAVDKAGTEPAAGGVGEVAEQAVEPSATVPQLRGMVERPWRGDLDGMLERRVIRALVVPTQTHYFIRDGKPQGIAAEMLLAFERYLNGKHAPAQRHLQRHQVYDIEHPTAADPSRQFWNEATVDVGHMKHPLAGLDLAQKAAPKPPVVAKQDGVHHRVAVEQASVGSVEVGPAIDLAQIGRDRCRLALLGRLVRAWLRHLADRIVANKMTAVG